MIRWVETQAVDAESQFSTLAPAHTPREVHFAHLWKQQSECLEAQSARPPPKPFRNSSAGAYRAGGIGCSHRVERGGQQMAPSPPSVLLSFETKGSRWRWCPLAPESLRHAKQSMPRFGSIRAILPGVKFLTPEKNPSNICPSRTSGLTQASQLVGRGTDVLPSTS